jgi:uncharacterized membrane protein
MKLLDLIVAASLTLAPAYAFADLKCGGTEPFWSLDIGAKKAVYKGIEGDKIEFEVASKQDATGLKPGIVQVFTLKGKGPQSSAVVQRQRCSDDMSDIEYSYEVTLTLPKEVFHGCCEIQGTFPGP